MKKLLGKKRLMIPVMAIVMLIAMAGSALAYVQNPAITTFPLTKERSSYNGYALMVQRILYDHQYGSGSTYCDGYFGTNTKNSVIAYQQDYGLSADGIVGSQTWGSLANRLYTVQTDDSTYCDYLGSSRAYNIYDPYRYTIGNVRSYAEWYVLHYNGVHQGIN